MDADNPRIKQYKTYIAKLKEANEELLKVIELQEKMIENQELIISHKDEEIELLKEQMDHLLKRVDRLLEWQARRCRNYHQELRDKDEWLWIL